MTFYAHLSNSPPSAGPYASLVTKANIRMILEESLDILKENKGLEIVHVEATDGTFVSIKLLTDP